MKDIKRSLYNKLTIEDRGMVDEYIPKMSSYEVNSFMQRLINYYQIESKCDVLEVKEESDSIIVFETSKILSKHKNNKIPFDKLLALTNVKITNKNSPLFYFISAIRKYFESEYIRLAPKDINFKNYLSNKEFQNQLYYKAPIKIGWQQDKNLKDKIHKFFVDLANKDNVVIGRIKNIKLPMRFYTYRINDISKNKKRIGIALDKNILPTNKNFLPGFGPNFKISTDHTRIDLINDSTAISLTEFIKNCGYWTSKNASIDGFDDRTAIIWFDGSDISNNQWKFPNGLIITNESNCIISMLYTSDGFTKMYQRFNINDKINKIILELKLDGYM